MPGSGSQSVPLREYAGASTVIPKVRDRATCFPARVTMADFPSAIDDRLPDRVMTALPLGEASLSTSISSGLSAVWWLSLMFTISASGMPEPSNAPST